MKGLTDIPGILVGHASDYDGLTGCTVVLCEPGAVAGGDIRGSATGTEEWDVLNPHARHRSHPRRGVCRPQRLRPRSSQRRAPFSGAQRRRISRLRRRACSHRPVARFCSISAMGKTSVRPTREMGESAAAAANDGAVVEGAVGAGTGATVGKILGMKHAMKSGIGSFTVELDGGVKVSALAAVNAAGDVRDPATGKIIAGARGLRRAWNSPTGAQVMKKGPAWACAPEHHAGSGRDQRRAHQSGSHQARAIRLAGDGADHLSGQHDVGWRSGDRAVAGNGEGAPGCAGSGGGGSGRRIDSARGANGSVARRIAGASPSLRRRQMIHLQKGLTLLTRLTHQLSTTTPIRLG